jgi:hypothetical protein
MGLAPKFALGSIQGCRGISRNTVPDAVCVAVVAAAGCSLLAVEPVRVAHKPHAVPAYRRL